jgi:hypothetical protein
MANPFPKAVFILLFLALSVASVASHAQTDCGEAMQSTLIAGQHIPVGMVTIENDEQYLYVTYQTDADWLISETHLDVATQPGYLKQTPKGNAVPGRFIYQSEHDPAVTTVIHTIDLSVWPTDSPLYIAAHSVVVSTSGGGSETAWGEGVDFPGANWAMYMSYSVNPCEPPQEPGVIDMESTAIQVHESAVLVTLKLVRSNGSDGQVTVTLGANDITATLFYDYEVYNYVVIFEDGETEKTIDVFILDDFEIETDEQFTVQITDVTGAEMGSNTATTITIIDDDKGEED